MSEPDASTRPALSAAGRVTISELRFWITNDQRTRGSTSEVQSASRKGPASRRNSIGWLRAFALPLPARRSRSLASGFHGWGVLGTVKVLLAWENRAV